MGNVDFGSDRLRLALIAVALFLGGYVAHSFMSGVDSAQRGVSPPALSMDAMAEKTFNYVAERFLKPQGIDGALLGVDKYGDSLYQVNFSLQRGGLTQNATVLVTTDGKLILLGNGGNIVDIIEDGGRENETRREEHISSSEADPYKGNADAPVTIVEYSDYQCPFCQKFWGETLPRIQSEYIDKGLVKFVFRDFPLSSIHPYAQKAAEAAQCAFEQGKFWEYHDRLFSDSRSWQREGSDEFKRIAKELGLDGSRFGECIDSGKYAGEVQRDLQDGIRAGVTGTPAFFVNGVVIEGAQPFAAFEEVIGAQLSMRSDKSQGVDVSDAAHVFGPANSPVTMIEFNDYQCPFCKKFRDETLDDLLQMYGGKIKYVFMDFPISAIHPQAFVAHIAARCAGDQGKYLQYHDKLFLNQQAWSRFAPESKEEIGELKKYASEIGLDAALFDQCLDSRKHADEVSSNMQKGVKLGVTGTPTFFINEQRVVGAQPLYVFQDVIAAQQK